MMEERKVDIIIGVVIVLLIVLTVVFFLYYKKEKMTPAIDNEPMGYGPRGNPGLYDTTWYPTDDVDESDYYRLEDKAMKQNLSESAQSDGYDFNAMLVDTLGADLKANHMKYANEIAAHRGNIRYLGVHQDYSFPGGERWGVNAFKPPGTNGGTPVLQRNDLPQVTSHTDAVEYAKMFNYNPDNYSDYI